MLNIGSFFIIIYCTKLLLTVLIGTLLAEYLIKPPPIMIKTIAVFFVISFIGIFLDKYFFQFPWIGIEAKIGGIDVDVSRDWMIKGADKRAAGFMRSSINAALIMPFFAFLLFFNTKSIVKKLLITIATAMLLYWTTQKSSIIMFVLISVIILIFYKRPAPALKIGIIIATILMIGCPIILPNFIMDSSSGVFSAASLYMRIEEIWPLAWSWIEKREAFPFGVGLGGIGGAQRFYAPFSVNYSDNMFIFLYAYFGMLSLLYIGWLLYICIKTPNKASSAQINALAIIMFILAYGITMSMLEDQVTSLFFGAAVSILASKGTNITNNKNNKKEIEIAGK
ncbi:MAG: hypothetical protein R3D71_11325 [Rickettsiales bacterium]